MFRPCVNLKTGAIETLEIENCPNIEEYFIVGVTRENNQASVDISGRPVDQEAPTRQKAIDQEVQYEEKLINEAVTESKRRKAVVEVPVETVTE